MAAWSAIQRLAADLRTVRPVRVVTPHKRPRRWVSLDTDYLTRPRIVELRRAFGPAGILVFLAIILECDKTERGRVTDTVTARYGPISEGTHATPDEVRGVIRKAESIGLLSIEREDDESAVVTLLERPKWAPRAMPRVRPPKRIPTDDRLLATLRGAGPLTAPLLADAIGLAYTGSFRARLKRLRDGGKVVFDGGSYSVAESR